MKFIIFSVLCCTKITNCSLDPNDYQMVITYGKPLKYSSPTIYSISFEDCVQKCWNDNICVLIYDTSPTCQMFVLSNITSVQKLNSSSNSRIAFRAYSAGKTCPDMPATPILTGGSVTGRTYYTIGGVLQTYQEFNITLNSKTNIWNFTPSSYYPCVMSMPMKRGNTVYCIALQPNIFSICKDKNETLADLDTYSGWTLMGIDNMGEYNYFRDTAIQLATTNPNKTYSNLGFWMDGSRKSACKYPTKPSANCNGTNEFNFSDKSLSNPVFQWFPGQPNGIQNEPPDSNCLYLRVSNQGDNGVDDMPCSSSYDSTLNLCFIGYIYGTPANPNN